MHPGTHTLHAGALRAGALHEPAAGDPPERPDVVTGERRRLIDLAYRLLGALTEAEDVVQEAFARWYAMAPERRHAVESPGAWLTTVTSRICLDLLGSARARRERYVGEWVPEPLPAHDERTGAAGSRRDDPADRVTLDESVSMAFLVVLDTMTPAERVAFVLHDVFRYPFADVAEMVGRTPAACRELASSARRRVRAARLPVTSVARQARVVRVFRKALEAGDVDVLVALLADDATAVGDGGGIASSVLHPVEGALEIARSLARLEDVLRRTTLLERTVNGQPGLIAQQGGVTVSVYAFEVADERITRIWAVRNPAKLRRWTAG